MPTLALAGGTSPTLGRAIVTAMLSTPDSSRWNTVILSRTPRIPLWLQAIDHDGKHTQIRVVDYQSIDSITAALEGVHTLISVTSAVDGTQALIQTNLLNAAVGAGCLRFAPSQWGFGPVGWEEVDVLKYVWEGVWEECKRHTDKIQCARFNNGSFMNYIGHGIYPVSSDTKLDEEIELLRELQDGGGYMVGEDAACQGLSRKGDLKDGSGGFLIGLANAIAELPVKDNGEWPRISMTALKDIGRFVVASLELPKWEDDMGMVGDTLTMGELLAHAEAVTGKTFRVERLTRQELEKKLSKVPQEDFMAQLWLEFKLVYCRDREGEVVLDPMLNRLCPQVKPSTAREFMEEHWAAL